MPENEPTPPASSRACASCLRRSALVARLAHHIARVTDARNRAQDLLALDDTSLMAALAPRQRSGVERWYERFDPVEARTSITAAELEAVCRHDPRYPAALHDLDAPPAILHIHGSAAMLDAARQQKAVAIVGARRASPYGLEVARGLGRSLAAAGVTVVSGMALGADSAAHAGALEVGGPTIAVLACGADVAYPASKRALHKRLVAEACVVSELPAGFAPLRWCFPARNRIIAGLTDVTVVVEASVRSGSLITARVARDLGRDVGAVPGRVTSTLAAGTNALIYDGAHPIRDACDILDLLYGAGCTPAVVGRDGSELAEDLRLLLAAVRDGRDPSTALFAREAASGEALAGLTELELLGYLRRAPGGRYEAVA